MAIDEAGVTAALETIADPLESGKNILEAGRVDELQIRQGDVRIRLLCPDFTREQRFAVEDNVVDALEAAGAGEVEVLVSSAGTFKKQAPAASAPPPGAPPGGLTHQHPPPGAPRTSPLGGAAPHGSAQPQMIPGVRNTIAVASAKGGVGKSTVAANLAVALEKLGNRVGYMDVDIYGPSAGVLFGVEDRPVADEHGRIWPLEKHGVHLMSLAFFAEPGEPVIWRGPMVGKLIKQFIDDVNWGERDFLIIDLPPGTGDAQLSLVQETRITGAVLVTTPSELALIDARKGHEMFDQIGIPVLGIVENMSWYICPSCKKRHEIFSHGGGRKAAEETGVRFLGELPLDPVLRAEGDAGTPLALRGPEDPHAAPFFQLARAVVEAAAEAVEKAGESQPDDGGDDEGGDAAENKRGLFNIFRG